MPDQTKHPAMAGMSKDVMLEGTGQGSVMGDYRAQDERRWTLQSGSALGIGHPGIVARGPSPGREPVEVVPAEQLRGAVDALRDLSNEAANALTEPRRFMESAERQGALADARKRALAILRGR